MKKFTVLFIAILAVLLIGIILFPLGYLSDQRTFHDITIPGDGYQMEGLLSEGTDPHGKWIILVHGNRKSGQDHELYRVIRNNLPEEYSILAIDLREFGGSNDVDPQQAPASINRSDDLQAAENYLANTYGVREDQIILIGHSFGAAQVMKDALDHKHLLIIPIGLGDWDALINDQTEIRAYIRKFQLNTGTVLEPEQLIDEGKEFSAGTLFTECPSSQVWLVYASQDGSIQRHQEVWQQLPENCQYQIKSAQIALSDHMYGTELSRLPEPLRGLYSKVSLSLLMYRLNKIVSSVGM